MTAARGPALRALRRALVAAAWSAIFLITAGSSVVVHLRTHAGRRVVAHATNTLVSKLLISSLRVERIEVLSPTELRVSRASLLDRRGKPILVAEGLEARFGLTSLLAGILDATATRIVIPEVHASRLAVHLDRDLERGGLMIETAFDPRVPSAPGTKSKPVVVSLSHISVDTATLATDEQALARTSTTVSALGAGLSVSSGGLVLTLKSGDVRVERLFAERLRARLDGELRLPGITRAVLGGRVGDAPFEANVRWHGKELELGLRSNELEPAAMRKLVPAWPLVVPLRVNATATGEPKSMHVALDATAGVTRADVKGTLSLTPEVATELDVALRSLDLRAVAPESPATALDLDGQLALALAGTGVAGTLAAKLGESAVGGYRVPPLDLSLKYADDRLLGTARVTEAELPVELAFQLDPQQRATFALDSKSLALEALGRYGVNAKGRATLHARGTLAHDELAATFDGVVGAPAVGPVRAASLAVRGRLDGNVRRLGAARFDVAVEGTGLGLAGLRLDRFHASAQGNLDRQALELETTAGDVSLTASAGLALSPSPVFRDVRCEARHAKDTLIVAAPRIALEQGGIEIPEFTAEIADGRVSGALSLREAHHRASITLRALDVARVLGALGVEPPRLAGTLDGNLTLDEVGHDRTGHAKLMLRHAALPPLENVAADVAVEFERADVAVHAELGVPELVRMELAAASSVRGSLFDPEALERASGTLALRFTDLDLSQAARLLPATRGVSLAGTAGGTVHVSRNTAGSAPTLSYELQTHGLTIADAGAPRGASSGAQLDIDSVGELLSEHGSRVAFNVLDAQGTWLAVKIEHALDFKTIREQGLGGLERAILDAPVDATLTAYRRPLDMLHPNGKSALNGSVAAEVALKGSARMPELEAQVSLFEAASAQRKADLAELETTVRYSAARETYALEAESKATAARIALKAAGHFGWVERGGLGSGWTATGEADLDALELARLGRFVDVPLGGVLSSHLRFDLSAERLDADGDLAVRNLSVERNVVGSGEGRLRMSAGHAEATLGIARDASRLELLAEAGFGWGAGGLELDPGRKGMLRATARDVDLAPVAPLLRGTLTRLAGRLNGRAELDWAALSAGKRRTTLRANATVRDGALSLAAGGGLIQSLEAQALAEGEGPLRITFSGAARSRQPNVKGKVELWLDGPRFERLDSKLELTSFPLLYDGVLMGRATTGAGAKALTVAVAGGDATQVVDVFIPSAEVKLPESNDKALIALDDDPAIVVSDAPVAPVEGLSAEAGNTTLKVRLGERVVIRRGSLEVPVRAALTVAPDGLLTGTITLPQGGVVPALGQVFRIERGVISFKDQAVKDGKLAIEAATRVADGTLIELVVSGTVRAPDITFRSDPPRSKNEIVALLLGIQSDTTNNSDGQQLGRTAMALAMNQLVEGSVLSGLQFGAGETTQGEAVSSVSVRVASNVWLEGRTVKGSSTSINPNERVSGVVDWRFAPSWSLRTQLGEISGVELRWSLRY